MRSAVVIYTIKQQNAVIMLSKFSSYNEKYHDNKQFVVNSSIEANYLLCHFRTILELPLENACDVS